MHNLVEWFVFTPFAALRLYHSGQSNQPALLSLPVYTNTNSFYSLLTDKVYSTK